MNWKAFMAAITVFAVLFLLVVVQNVELTRGNFAPGPGYLYPTVVVFSPTNGTVYHSSNIGCSFSTGTLNLNRKGIQGYEEWVVVYLDSKMFKTLQYLPSSYTLTLENLTDGQHHLEVTANVKWSILSAVFETGRSTVDFTVRVPIIQPNDTGTPSPTLPISLSASLAESASSLYFGNTINFTATAEGGKEPYVFAWSVDNQTVQVGSSPYYSTDVLPVGEHHVYVQVVDAQDTTATTLTVAFEVLHNPSASPAPSPSPSVPEFPTWITLPTAAAVAMMLVFFVRRRKQ